MALEPLLLECLNRLQEQNVSKRCTTRACSYIIRALNTLPKHTTTMSERCGSKASIAGAWFQTSEALWLQSIYCRSVLSDCRSASSPETVLPKRVFVLSERMSSLLKRSIQLPER
ncbi:hypothetical protein AMTR_s00003p00271540 [Amborella trichopoda]|uniref:Uncharacterized protein n=1 Tax=Amborella trichopoda TaxID=13333 RepID=W1P6I2_AMBTC|nr:hypothetical protein AMTR_s00003p00271540 [Amborella trichopoda]